MSVEPCECCGKEFGLPIKLTVVSGGPNETYFACPFCFTKVAESRAEVDEEPVVSKRLNKARGRGKVEAAEAGFVGCNQHFGYLKGRTKNEVIPDECLVCPKILDCMT